MYLNIINNSNSSSYTTFNVLFASTKSVVTHFAVYVSGSINAKPNDLLLPSPDDIGVNTPYGLHACFAVEPIPLLISTAYVFLSGPTTGIELLVFKTTPPH